jgi:hypothetical protein
MPPVGLETTISAGVRPQTYALDRAAIGTGSESFKNYFEENYLYHLENVTTISPYV